MTSYEVAPVDDQDNVIFDVPTPVAPSAGEGDAGADGAAAAVVKDHTGPVDVPLPLRATICQKYVVPLASAPGTYDAAACPAATDGGGFVVPKLTS